MTNEELEHSGVKGMKWGVRKAVKSYKKARKQSKARKVRSKIEEDEMRKAVKAKIVNQVDSNGNLPRTIRPTATDSKRREKEWKKIYKDRGSMTDAEIKNSLSRLKLENELQKASSSASEAQRKQRAEMVSMAIKAIGALPMKDAAGNTTNVKGWAAGELKSMVTGGKDKTIKQSDATDILEHYGVKGMKWKMKKEEVEPHEDIVGAGGSELEPIVDDHGAVSGDLIAPKPKKKWEMRDKALLGESALVNRLPKTHKSKKPKDHTNDMPNPTKKKTPANVSTKKRKRLDDIKKLPMVKM